MKKSKITRFIISSMAALSLLTMPIQTFAQANEPVTESENTGSNSSNSSNTSNVVKPASTSNTSSSNDKGDVTPPTLNAAINNGKLTVEADDESGIKAIYVNGYQFLDPLDGILNIRLEKFDASAETFAVSAMDNEGNKSKDYTLSNPYWTDPNAKDNSGEDPAAQLPADASATNPSSASGNVTDHVKTDAEGNLVQKEEQFYYTGENDPAFGREFYTIETRTGKVFYLIVERNEEEEIVHFVTDITENDLLNATDDNSEVLPKNSLAARSSIPAKEVAIPDKNGNTIVVDSNGKKSVVDSKGNPVVDNKEITDGAAEDAESRTASENEADQKKASKKQMNPIFIYIIVGGIVIAVGYYVKVLKPKKQGDFIEDEEAAEALEEEQYSDDEINTQPSNLFSREQSDEDFINNFDPNDNGGE